MVDHVHLFHPAFEELKRAAAARGPVRAIESSAGAPGERPDMPTLWNWGPHDVAMCIDLLGAAPTTVDAARIDAKRLWLGLAFAGGARADIELDLREKHRRFSVRLDSGTLSYDGAPPLAAADWPLARAVRAFAAAATQGSRSLESVELGAAVVR